MLKKFKTLLVNFQKNVHQNNWLLQNGRVSLYEEGVMKFIIYTLGEGNLTFCYMGSQKKGGLTGSQLSQEVAGKEGVIFSGGLQLYKKMN